MSEPENPQSPSDPPAPPSDPPAPPSDPPAPPSDPPAPPPPSAPSGSGSPNVVMVILSYLGILALIPFLVEKDDKEVQWHAKHGLVLLVGEFALFIVLSVLGAISAGLGCLLWPLVILALIAIHVMCIVKGVNGDRFIIPGVSQYADKF